VAAENIWGSIAAQLGGDRVSVKSIIDNPATDPHDYEATTSDARAFASARYVIVNGVGYDSWAAKLVSANPVSGRIVLDIGDLVGVNDGDNPHLWYFPDDVAQVIDRVTSDLEQLDPPDAAYFDARHEAYATTGLAKYHELLAGIKATYTGTPVGASESVFVGLAQFLGLDLATPARYLDAISEGIEPTAGDKATVDAQIAQGKIKVFVYNSQNATPDVQTVVKAAKAKHIPVTTVTETLSPAGATFQDWQVAQLEQLQAALAGGTSG
jgi:zinc/manganese transport system substrate-binding protein